jgi:hypothetical protein
MSKCCLVLSQELKPPQRINSNQPWIVCMGPKCLTPMKRNMKNVFFKAKMPLISFLHVFLVLLDETMLQ